eukprot:gnl/TRDRNA2_/TRDRNA2_129831_c0_seq2.p1 gnl/TRDRNA2_/TRDRNA2_129831_c0~~gnl/TRDRNA2_/TRDRNA2_129831_c0_seq2.p1  ORF type:complete len:257 (+),score=67.26 gnl/TRDRNA2_/TRDRNA2_129831_c0_seq2:184-954(+)
MPNKAKRLKKKFANKVHISYKETSGLPYKLGTKNCRNPACELGLYNSFFPNFCKHCWDIGFGTAYKCPKPTTTTGAPTKRPRPKRKEKEEEEDDDSDDEMQDAKRARGANNKLMKIVTERMVPFNPFFPHPSLPGGRRREEEQAAEDEEAEKAAENATSIDAPVTQPPGEKMEQEDEEEAQANDEEEEDQEGDEDEDEEGDDDDEDVGPIFAQRLSSMGFAPAALFGVFAGAGAVLVMLRRRHGSALNDRQPFLST